MDISPEPGDTAKDTTIAPLDNLEQLALSGAAAEAYLIRHNPDALLIEPRDLYRAAIVGVTRVPTDNWPRSTAALVAVYSIEAVIGAVMGSGEGTDYTTACDYFYYNVAGAWMGEGTPTFV